MKSSLWRIQRAGSTIRFRFSKLVFSKFAQTNPSPSLILSLSSILVDYWTGIQALEMNYLLIWSTDTVATSYLLPSVFKVYLYYIYIHIYTHARARVYSFCCWEIKFLELNVCNSLFLLDPGQANLLKSSILVVGAGGLGSPALLYLAACGVGKFFWVKSFIT